jgi:hypothetical protein
MSPAANAPRSDPFWDLDGAGARRSRRRRQIIRAAIAILIAALAIVLAVTLAARIPEMDPGFVREAGRPLLAAAVLSLLAAAVLIGLARMRRPASR